MWEEQAACRHVDPETFFPVAGEDSPAFAAQAETAIAVCAGCPVKRECLALAVELGAEGIWAGTTISQRRRLKLAGAR